MDERDTLRRAEGRCPARQNEVSVRNRSTTAHHAPAPSHQHDPRSAPDGHAEAEGLHPAQEDRTEAPARRRERRPAGATSINLGALGGRSGFAVGDKVRILGTGLYAGEIAVIERMANGAIPSAAVRTEAGRARTVRTVDLEPAAQRTES